MSFYQLRANYKGVLYPIERYYDYSLKEVLKLYREKHNLLSFFRLPQITKQHKGK